VCVKRVGRGAFSCRSITIDARSPGTVDSCSQSVLHFGIIIIVKYNGRRRSVVNIVTIRFIQIGKLCLSLQKNVGNLEYNLFIDYSNRNL
jgi:hypothetical protein